MRVSPLAETCFSVPPRCGVLHAPWRVSRARCEQPRLALHTFCADADYCKVSNQNQIETCRAGGGKEERGAAVASIQQAAFAALKGEQHASKWPNLDDITVRQPSARNLLPHQSSSSPAASPICLLKERPQHAAHRLPNAALDGHCTPPGPAQCSITLQKAAEPHSPAVLPVE